MKTINIHVATACALALAALQPAHAQSTDGYHSIQIFPVVVDSPTFSQRFTFRNPDADTAVTVVPRYFPGNGTSQAVALACPEFVIPAGGQIVYQSLRLLCPGLASGAQFGFLYTNESNSGSQPYAAFSRVTNFAGQGFSVEAFPAHTFTASDSVVTGIRRLAATGSSPTFQSNCFIGNLNDVTSPPSPVVTRVNFTVSDSGGAPLGSSFVDLEPGKLTRLLDVFAAVGAAEGDYNDARIEFLEDGAGEPGLMTFCTVQDNTSFGADFRIGKQEEGYSTAWSTIGGQDDHLNRHTTTYADMPVPGETLGRSFVIAPGQSSNTHVFYFRHPDWVECEIVDPVTRVRALASYGLELRMLAPDGETVVAGGDEIYGFSEIYLGDKPDVNNGANGRYTVEVESAAANNGVARPYGLHCHSGSGHTLGDMVRDADVDRF